MFARSQPEHQPDREEVEEIYLLFEVLYGVVTENFVFLSFNLPDHTVQ